MVGIRVAFFLLASLATASCAVAPRTPEPADPIADAWNDTMARYHMHAVYPPTSDVHVGDIYAFINCTQAAPGAADACVSIKTNHENTAVKVDYIPVAGALNEYYQEIATIKDGAQPGGGISAKEPASRESQKAAGGGFEMQGPPVDLPDAALPGFSTYFTSDVDIGTSFPAKFVSLVMGANKAKRVYVSVSFGGVTTYGIPAFPAINSLQRYCNSTGRCTEQALRSVLLLKLGTTGNSAPMLGLVDRVYLAKSITFTFGSDAAAAVGANVIAGWPSAIANQSRMQTATGTSAGTTQDQQEGVSKGDVKSSGDADASQLSDAQSAAMAAEGIALTSKSPGIRVFYSGSNGQQITLSETFDKPVAVGYAALIMPFEITTRP